MDFSCCLYMSGRKGHVRQDKENTGSRGDRVVGGGTIIVYKVLREGRNLNFGSHHCGADIKYVTG